MSWQAYVDQQLMGKTDAKGTTLLSSAALIGLDSKAVLAQSSDFPGITEEETAFILSVMELGLASLPTQFSGRPLIIGGVKLGGVLQHDEAMLHSKFQGGGCSINKTGQMLVVGIFKEPSVSGACREVVEALADSLRENGL